MPSDDTYWRYDEDYHSPEELWICPECDAEVHVDHVNDICPCCGAIVQDDDLDWRR